MLIIEDDPYGDLFFDDVATVGDTRPLKADDRDGRVIYLSTFSKTLAPGFRVAWVVGPAAGLVLLTGLAMVGMGHIGFGTFWVWFGYAGVLVHAILGGFILRKRAEAVLRLASGGAGDDVAMVAAARRLWNTQLVYLVLLAIVIAGMVIKPVP